MAMIELAYIRNELYRNKFTDEYLSTLLSIKELVRNNGNPYNSLISICIDFALEHINKNEFDQAAEEINFIHNFPIDNNFSAWDADHFFNIELLGYIEKNENTSKLREIIKKISEFC